MDFCSALSLKIIAFYRVKWEKKAKGGQRFCQQGLKIQVSVSNFQPCLTSDVYRIFCSRALKRNYFLSQEASVDTNGEWFCLVQKSEFGIFYWLTFLGISNKEDTHASFGKNYSSFAGLDFVFNRALKTTYYEKPHFLQHFDLEPILTKGILV